jgi:hypothetical protein
MTSLEFQAGGSVRRPFLFPQNRLFTRALD